jgi:hypothetical protein
MKEGVQRHAGCERSPAAFVRVRVCRAVAVMQVGRRQMQVHAFAAGCPTTHHQQRVKPLGAESASRCRH